MWKLRIAGVLSLGMTAACATAPEGITTASVSPLGYQGFSCQQLEAEIVRVTARVDDLNGQQHHKANADALMVGVSLFVFAPALLAVQGNGTTAAELSRHKGELVAMEQMAVEKGCQVQIVRPKPLPKAPPPPPTNPT